MENVPVRTSDPAGAAPTQTRTVAVQFETDLFVHGHGRRFLPMYDDELDQMSIFDVAQIFARAQQGACQHELNPEAFPVMTIRVYANEKGLAAMERLGTAIGAVIDK